MASLAAGGAQRTTVNLANYFTSLRCSVTLAVGTARGPHAHDLRPGVRIVELGASRVRYAVPGLARVLRAARPDLAFAPMPDANIGLALAAKLSRTSSRLVLRESNHRPGARSIPSPFQLFLTWAYRSANLVLTPSQGLAREVIGRHGLEPSRVSAIPNPVDLARIRAACAGGSPHSASPQQPARPYLVAAGRLIPQKGFDLLVSALRVPSMREVHLTLIGEGPEQGRLSHLAASLGVAGRVSFAGYVHNPYKEIRDADAFILPSRWEGFPNVLLEAMACGTPVVATRCRWGPDEIITHEQDGLLSEPNSAEALAVEIDRLVRDKSLARSLAERAAHTVMRYDAPRIAEEYLALFTSLIH